MTTISHVMAHLSELCKIRQCESQCWVVKNCTEVSLQWAIVAHSTKPDTELMLRTATGITTQDVITF